MSGLHYQIPFLRRGIFIMPCFKKTAFLLAVTTTQFIAASSAAQVRHELQSEWAYSDAQQETTKTDFVLRSEYKQSLGEWRMTLLPKTRLSFDESLYGPIDDGAMQSPENYSAINGPWYRQHNGQTRLQFELQEAYWDRWFDSASLRLGKQQVVWGQADGLKVLDVVNPQNLTEFNLPVFEESRIATWMVNFQHPFTEWGTLQWLLIPDLTFNEHAENNTDFAMGYQGPLPVETLERPANDEFEYGVRWSAFISGWDVTLNYLSFFQDNPVFYRTGFDVGLPVLQPTYKRSELFGGTANTTLGQWVLKAELGYVTPNYFSRVDNLNDGIAERDEWSGVMAFDYQGVSDVLLSYQFFVSHVEDSERVLTRKSTSVRHTILVVKDAWQETLELRFFALLNRDYKDGQSRFKASYQLTDHHSIWGGVDYFYGDRQGPFGQFSNSSRALLGWRWDF